MGFKVNTSFLRFLTMGAAGVRSTMDYLRQEGFDPLELERYCASNKIWMTKVKRLRLPDVLCARTGLRVEVRAKSDLKIRMSDAPNNPDRRWDVGLRDDDVVAFAACDGGLDGIEVLGPPVCFFVGDLRATVGATKLGPPKSASEGAERDREWKSTVPSKDGEVLEVPNSKIVTQLDSGRRQTYQLRGKFPYVAPGDSFVGGASMIAGAVRRLAPLATAKARVWDPLATLEETDEVDRYAAAKAIPHSGVATSRARRVLLAAMKQEPDDRVALEMAASAARLEAEAGLEYVVSTVWNHEQSDLRMEAVFVLTELGTAAAAAELSRVATAREFEGDEIRQAATWGLGREGCRAYAELIELLGDQDDAVALHAIAAFGGDVPKRVVRYLVKVVQHGAPRQRAAASEALRLVDSQRVLRALIDAAHSGEGARPWLLATLGRLDSMAVREALAGDPLLVEVEPLIALGPTENWLATTEAAEDLRFLLLQRLEQAPEEATTS
jgi:HEAT repeat protein